MYEPVITKYVSTIRSPTLKGATWLYKPVGGAGASVCIISNMLSHQGCFFSKLRNIYK